MGKTILISRTDSIGDVVLTLPICARLKQRFPNSKIIFLGQRYTQPITQCFSSIDEILDWKELTRLPLKKQIEKLQGLQIDICIHVFPKKEIAQLMKKAKIPCRIGTSHRLYHFFTCNIRPSFTRKKSPLHEAQLNFQLLQSLGVKNIPSLKEMILFYRGFQPQKNLNSFLNEMLATSTKKIILHTKSQGSAVEWPIEKYIQLAQLLIKEDYTVYFSGTEQEGQLFRTLLPLHPQLVDISGKSTLEEFVYFISQCDCLVACSTGPLHLSGILGIKTIGLYTELRPMHPGRWAPIGKNIEIITKKGEGQPSLEDIRDIQVEQVYNKIKRG